MSRYIVFNDGRCHGIKLNHDPFCAVIFDIQRLTRARVLPLPVHTVSPDGLQGLHVSFGRQELAQAGAAVTHMHAFLLFSMSAVCLCAAECILCCDVLWVFHILPKVLRLHMTV